MKLLLIGRLWLVVVLLFHPVAGLVAADAQSPEDRDKDIDAAYQTVFFSVLEGCFQDGVSNEDVDRMLLPSAPGSRLYEHFIYACPICMATARALETYRTRAMTEKKTGGQVTFGKGLTPEMHARLFSDDQKDRLSVMHDLEERWVSRHVGALRMNAEEAALMQAQLKLAREQGLAVVQSFQDRGKLNEVAPGYHTGDECALCNAATGMNLKLASDPAR